MRQALLAGARWAELRTGLDEEQRAAVEAASRTVRVKAGPGSGKTRVLVARALHLVAHRGVPPHRILAITFTQRAAGELEQRLAGREVGKANVDAASSELPFSDALVGAPVPPVAAAKGGVAAKTFHGLGSYLLRSMIESHPHLAAGLQYSRVFDADDSEQLLFRTILKEDKAVSAHEAGRLARHVAKTGRLAMVKSRAAAAGHFDDDTAVQFVADQQRWITNSLGPYYAAYQRALRQHRAVDFADLISLPVRLLATHPELREHWRARFDHILVDEFQDTDPAQYALVRLLRRPGAGLFVVGDPDQAIYGWRGAEPHGMTTYLERDYPDTQTFLLSTNYRSHPEIVDAADRLLQLPGVGAAAVGGGLYKKAVAVRPGTAGVAVHGTVYEDDADEVDGVVETIAKLREQHPRGPDAFPLHEVAVLYRMRWLSHAFEEALTLRGIPFIVVGAEPFWKSEEVRVALAYLQVAACPEQCDMFLEYILTEPKVDKPRTKKKERMHVRRVPKGALGKALGKSLLGAAAAAGTTLGGLLFGDILLSNQERQDRDAAAAAAGTAGTAQAAAGRRRRSARWAGAMGVLGVLGVLGILGAKQLPPAIPSWSPLAGVQLKGTAMEELMALRGLVAEARRMMADECTVAEVLNACLRLSGHEDDIMCKMVSGLDCKGAATAVKRVRRDSRGAAKEAEERWLRLQSLKRLAAAGSWRAHVQHSTASTDGAPDLSGSSSGEVLDVGLPGLLRFLEHSALCSRQHVAEEDAGEHNAVRLMTLHAAKGLEFEHVFIVGLEDGILPSSHTLGPDGNPIDIEELQEEARVLYVGMTRAKDVLRLCWAKARKDRRMEVSRFMASLALEFKPRRT